MLYGNHAFYSWFGLNNPLVYAAHNAAGGMTSLYRQIGTGCEQLFRRLIRDQFKLMAVQAAWSFTITVPGRVGRTVSSLDHRALTSFEEELDMRSGITRRRAPHEWPARWLRATFPVVLGLGGLAGCALPTEVATPKLGQSLDNVRQEVAQLRTETAQLDALFRVVEDGVWARDAVLVQLDAALAQLGKRLQVLEKDVPLLKRPSGPRGPLLAAGSDSGRPSGHRLQVGMSPDAVRARLGAPSASKRPRTLSSGTMGPSGPWFGGTPSACRAGSGLPPLTWRTPSDSSRDHPKNLRACLRIPSEAPCHHNSRRCLPLPQPRSPLTMDRHVAYTSVCERGRHPASLRKEVS